MPKVAFFSNYINHHQLPFSLEMDRLTNGNFNFISQKAISEKRIALGYRNISNDYNFVVRTYESENELNRAFSIADNYDYVIFGATKDDYFYNRLKNNKITFEYSERLNKRKPSLYLWCKKYGSLLIHRRKYKNKKLFLLCSGAYVANDFNMFDTYKGKTYKWGYFPETIEYDIDALMKAKNKEKIIMLWAGRLIEWKHPELMIKLAKTLKDDNYDFEIRIIGQGVLENEIIKEINENHLEKHVKILGPMPPKSVREQMEKANIFVFTSDTGEGWGAVLNEAMNSGCACVASHAIGSTGFLIKQNENGIVYKNGDFDDLYSCVISLFDKEYREKLARNAYYTIKDEWNAKVASERFLVLAKALDEGKDTPYLEGPCSKAEPIKDKNMYDYIVNKK